MWCFSHCLFLVSSFEEGYFWKLFIRFVVGWTFTKPFWLERSFLPQTAYNLTTKRNAFLLTIPTCTDLPIGFTQTTALMFVWNLRASIGSLCSIFLKNAGIRVTIANPQMGKSCKGQQGRYQGFQVDRWSVSLRTCSRKFYSTKEYSHSSWIYPLPLQAGFYEKQLEKPFLKCIYCLQRCSWFFSFGYVWKICNCNYRLLDIRKYLWSGILCLSFITLFEKEVRFRAWIHWRIFDYRWTKASYADCALASWLYYGYDCTG